MTFVENKYKQKAYVLTVDKCYGKQFPEAILTSGEKNCHRFEFSVCYFHERKSVNIRRKPFKIRT